MLRRITWCRVCWSKTCRITTRRLRRSLPSPPPQAGEGPANPHLSPTGGSMESKSKLRIAHLAGPNATIQTTPPLDTSNKARQKHNLPLLTKPDDSVAKYDELL